MQSLPVSVQESLLHQVLKKFNTTDDNKKTSHNKKSCTRALRPHKENSSLQIATVF